VESAGQLTAPPGNNPSRLALRHVIEQREAVVEFSPTSQSDGPNPEAITDDELSALALAADPLAPLAPDALPWDQALAQRGLLPDWYMPRPTAGGRRTATRVVVFTLVAGFLIIGAFGLCITSGFLSLA
jgi:hypothetical protein